MSAKVRAKCQIPSVPDGPIGLTAGFRENKLWTVEGKTGHLRCGRSHYLDLVLIVLRKTKDW